MTWWVELGNPPFENGRDGFPLNMHYKACTRNFFSF